MTANAKRSDELQQRLIQFGARTSRIAKMLPRTEEGRYISQQILCSDLAPAANCAEARAAESRADFLHKLRIVLKELNETKNWLEQIVANGLFSRDKMVAIYRGKSGAALDYRSLCQDRSPFAWSNLRFGISGFEIPDLSNSRFRLLYLRIPIVQ